MAARKLHDSEQFTLEDMLLNVIEDAIATAGESGELLPRERVRVVREATEAFMRDVKQTADRIAAGELGSSTATSETR